MGILTRKQSDRFVISSDLTDPLAKATRAPNRHNDSYLVWTGLNWSLNINEAQFFDSMDDADEYVRANYPKLST